MSTRRNYYGSNKIEPSRRQYLQRFRRQFN
ncbi:cation-transporting P-type ATPase [Bacillus clarus]